MSALQSQLHTFVWLTWTYARALFSGHRLPPGSLSPMLESEKRDRRFLLNRSEQLGPIFKLIQSGRIWICVVGMGECRDILRQHSDDLKPVTIDLTPLFPRGFMRQMRGSEHAHYRKHLVAALESRPIDSLGPSLSELVSQELGRYAHRQDHQSPPEFLTETLRTIATAMLIEVFFGVDRHSPVYQPLLAAYQKLGPNGFVWLLGEPQRQAFQEICHWLGKADGALLASLAAVEGALDDTMLGNLIYMVEMGRADLTSLFRWILKFAAERPALVERLAVDAPLVEAFVRETLRMEQSERVVRKIERDFVFQGYFFPRGATLRCCLWESHKLSAHFPDPFHFDPDRFSQEVRGTHYAPFGLDHHHCPLADATVRLSSLFLRVLAQQYRLTPVDNQEPIRGSSHWEPARQFSVRLHPR